MNLLYKNKAFIISCILLSSSCNSFPGEDKKYHYEISFMINKDIYTLSDWSEPPQFAVWLEEECKKEIQTVFVTHRTARDNWKGIASCPVSLPYWVNKYKKEYKTDQGPSYQNRLPDAYTGATPDQSFSGKFGIDPGKWNLFLEVNVSGDYNDYHERESDFSENYDFGNGQPSLVYMMVMDTSLSNTNAVVIGCTSQFSFSDSLYPVTTITTAKQLLQNIKVIKIK